MFLLSNSLYFIPSTLSNNNSKQTFILNFLVFWNIYICINLCRIVILKSSLMDLKGILKFQNQATLTNNSSRTCIYMANTYCPLTWKKCSILQQIIQRYWKSYLLAKLFSDVSWQNDRTALLYQLYLQLGHVSLLLTQHLQICHSLEQTNKSKTKPQATQQYKFLETIV